MNRGETSLRITLLRAGDVGSNIPPKVTVEIHDQISDDEFSSLADARELYAGQARALSDSLFASLPGGTIDALLVEMMKRKVSLFSVPFVTESMSWREKEAVYVDKLNAQLREIQHQQQQISDLIQTSFDLCPECGWRTMIPEEGCLKCNRRD